MLNYSIMSLDPDHIDEFCEDIINQVKSGVATMPLFCLTLTPEGDPAIDKADIGCRTYDLYKEKLDAAGVPSGILIQATIGHGWKLNQASAFQKIVALSDGSSREVCCPLDKGFQAYVRAAAERIASSHPDHIMLDDDFRLMQRSKKPCACPLHMEKISTLIGRPITREELRDAIDAENDASSSYRDAFIKAQLDSLIECAHEIRAGIDSIDPSIPGSFCLAGDSAEAAYEIASIMAGKGNPVVLRFNNANYCATDPRNFIHSMHRAASQIAALSGRPDVLLAETDTCPQNRYSTPAAKLHSHFTFSILEGADGAKHWITRLASFEPASGKAYRKKLETYNGFYHELSRLTPHLTWQGCAIPVWPRPTYNFTPNDVKCSKNDGWCSHVLDRFGLPMHFSAKGEGARFFDSAKDFGFTDEEILTFLSGKVVLDAPVAQRLIARGFGKYLGVDVKTREEGAKNASGEIVYPCGNTKAQYGVCELIPLCDEVKHYSDVYHLRDGKYRDIMFPGVTSYQNELGGTVVVFSGTTIFPYTLADAYGFLNETRKKQLIGILSDLDCLPVYYPDDAEVFLKAARVDDGRLFCAVLDMSLDAVEELPLVLERPAKRVQRLMPDGSYEDLAFTCEDGRIILPITAYPFDPVILLIDWAE